MVFDLVVPFFESNLGLIISFIKVEEWLDYFNYDTNLEIHIAIVLAKKISVLWNHPTMIKQIDIIFNIKPSNNFCYFV